MLQNVCQLGLKVKVNCYTKKAAYNAFIKLIELFKDHDLKFDETVRNYYRTFHNYDKKERRFIFCVLGKIIKHVESICLSQKYLDVIFQQLYYDAREEYDSKINVRKDFYMYFDALADILDGVVEPLNALKDKRLSDSYKWIKDLGQSKKQPGDDEERVRTVTKSAIDFLCRHMNLFQDLLYPDCMYWHDSLRRLSLKTTTYGIYGQRALKRFYQVIGQILTNQNSNEKKILEKFVEYFDGEFQKTNLNLTTLRLIVYGFSQMAAPCKVHMTQFEVRRMYSITTSYALPLCSSEHSHSTHIESICCYQEALSEILRHMTDVTIENINILIKLSNYVIKRFPDLAVSNNALAVSTLTKTISNLVSVDKALLQRYLDNIVYDGIAWSCSHTLALDAELQRELNNVKQSPICYKNYLPLWTELLNAERYRGQEQLAQHVANTMIDVCIKLINQLNINVKRRNEDTVLSDVALTQSAVNQADFRVFANVVDLYVDVIDAEPQLFINTVYRFLYEVIRLSYKYPLISGFYKLIRAGMKVFTHTSEDEEEEKSAESRRTEELLSNYLWHTLDLIPAFSNELLIACLYLILDAPFAYVKDALPCTLPVFKIAFTAGLSNLELAYNALTALEIWTTKAQEQKQDEQINELLREIIVYLEPYLRSTESSVEVSQDLMTARKRVKRVDVINTDHTLRNYQRRVLLFLGSLDHDMLTSFVHEHASRNTGASWDYKELSKICKYSLLLPDAELVIHFDRMLPRIIALARDSSDRRTKIAACEVLHSMIAIIIGSRNSDSETRFPTLYSTLCQAVLTLGCDSDEIVCGLFRPLALQLMHLWSSSLQSMSLVIDSLFDSLTNDSNPALREFSGMCLAEFTHWSIRQSMTDRTQHVGTIIEKINNLALHPLTRKRIAAAVAFNHLYVILREEDDIVSIYWLKIFYCFVRSLEGCDDPSITNALAHIERVMKVKAESLKMPSSRRQKLPDFNDATLTSALYWLLSQCGNLDEHCRSKCMELYINVSQHIDSSAQETMQNFIHTYEIKYLNNIILKGLESGVKDISMATNMTPLLKALDYYMWLINEKLLPVEKFFPADIDEQPIFSHIRSFTCQFWRIIEESSTGTAATTMKSKELEQLQALQCKVLMTTLNFVQVLLNVNVNVPDSLWDESLTALMIRCIMHPQTLGFDVKNIKITDELPHVLETLLSSMRSRYDYALPDIFNKCLLNFIREIVTKLLDLQDIIKNDSCDDLIQHVNGLILLKRCDMLYPTMLETSTFTDADYTVKQIFEFLVSKCIGELVCKDLSMQMIEYLRALMEFQFSLLPATIETPVIIPDDVRSIIDNLVKFMSNNDQVTSVDCTIITHGEHFLNTFKSVIFKYMLTHVSAITHVFENTYDNPSFLLKWIEDMLLFLKQHSRELQAHVDTMVDLILQQFTCLKNIIFNVDSRKERLMNIYSIAVYLKSKPTEVLQYHEFYQWIRNELRNNNNLEYKTKILKNFFVCLTDVVDRNDLQISWILRNDSRHLCSNLSEMTVNAMKVIDCFETLLVLLSTTKSKIMLKCVIDFAAGTGNRLFDEKLEEHLRGYYYRTSLEHVLDSLQTTYSAFMEMNTTETERLDILHGFLLPAFKFCDSTAIEHFFECNYKVLYDYYIDFLNISNHDDAIKQKIVTMIGYSQLLTIMFARVDKNKIQANEPTIQNPESKLKILVERSDYQYLVKNIIQIFQESSRWSVRQGLIRQLQCSLYNCLLSIISLKEDEKSYRLVFNSFGWEKIVDCTTQYKLGQIFKEYPKTREITVNIRSAEVEREEQTHRCAYVHSYDLSSCTLSEDINAYDLNKCVVLPANFRRSTPIMNSADSDPLHTHHATNITLTSNDFDKHECMPYICVLLRHIRKVFGSTNTKPQWLECFFNTMQDNNCHANIKLFMLKIISNTANEVFKPYAKFALTKIIKTIADYLQGNNDLNYIITDVLKILIDWHDVAIPNNEDSKAEAQKLFEKFIDKVFKRKSDDEDRVYNYNLNLLRTMVEKWRGCLRIPSDFLNRQITSAPSAAVYLILVSLENNMTEEIVIRDDIVNFLLEQLKNWDTPDSDKTPLYCCECLGLYLRFLDNNSRDEIERDNKKHVVKEKISNILGLPQNRIDKQVKRVAVLCQTYPEVAQDYINIATRAMYTTKYSTKCLEIFALAIPRLNVEDQSVQDVVTNLHYIRLQNILETRMSSCEKIALQIVRDVVDILPIQNLPYKQVILYVKDNITEHRELVYDILMRIHKRCSAAITVDDNEIVQDLLSVSKRNLVAGLLDPSPDLQDRILKFWTEEMKLNTEELKKRLISPLTILSSQLITEEDAFAPFVALLMLQQATKSICYTEKIFDEPLPDSDRFKEYKIPVSWRRRNLSCVTPMFVDSLASQMSYNIFSQNVDNYLSGICMTPTFSYPWLLPGLRTTQDLQFEPTLDDDDNAADATTTLNISSHDTGFDQTIIASSSRQPLRTAGRERFTGILANTSNATNDFRNAEVQRNAQRAERIQQENIRQRSTVKLYRNYRIGELPDIEITHESFIVSLQQLVKLDRLICKDVIVSLFFSLTKKTTNQENIRQTIVDNLKRILHDLCERDSSFNAVILETLLKLSQDAATIVNCDPQDVMKASKANHLNAVGILLLEHSLLPDAQEDDSAPTSSKRMRLHDDAIRYEETNKWVQLASLYKSLNDVDVVLSIFRGQQFFGQNVQEAALAEVNGDWIRAKDAFTKAYEETTEPSIKEHCLQGLLEAVNNLCDWSAIDKLVKSRARNENLHNIWNDAWKDWMIPCACDAYVHMMSEERDLEASDMETIKSWIYSREKLQHLMPLTGENLVIFLLNFEDMRKATDLLNDLLDMTGKQWVGINPLCTELRIRKLFKLQIMNDLDASLKILRCTSRAEYLNRTIALLNLWSMKTTTIRDNLIQWNKLTADRAYSSMLFQNKCRKREVTKRYYQMNYQLRLGIINAALNQKHRYIAEKHLNYVSEAFSEEDVSYLDMVSDLEWLKARLKCLFADVETDIFKKMSNYTDSWKNSHRLLNGELGVDTSNAIREHISTMASKIELLSRENQEFAIALKYNTKILRDIGNVGHREEIAAVPGIPVDDLDKIQKYFLGYSLKKLQSCCEDTTTANVGKHYCALAKHCYGRLMSTDVESDEIFQEFLLSTLKSMYHDCLEATHYFPCLLRPERLQNDETREMFVRECDKLRPWLFLRWRDLLFSHLGIPSISIAIMPIIKRLAKAYPDAIIYNYYHTIERNPSILEDVNIQQICSLLHDKVKEYERFLQAMQYVVQPQLYFQHYLNKAINDPGNTKAIASLLQRVHPNSSTSAIEGKNPRPGDIFEKIARDSKIRSLNPDYLDVEKEKTKLEKIRSNLNTLMQRQNNRNNRKGSTSKLNNYSPFLYEYVGGSIEIPGQYTGDREPIPRYHVRIARFEPQVEVMQSLRKPIRISMIGDNGKEYKFLVKFGEDLIIDRGLQQLYSTMNRTLRNDPSCRQRHLAIDTYEVIPISNSFGLIQWIEDTRSLNELIYLTLSDKETDCCNNIGNKYGKWIQKAASEKQLNSNCYIESVSKYSQQAVTEKMNRLIRETKQTALRDAFNSISPSPECFVTLRRNFIISYATMCVAHWLAGIGDRHLQNTLVRVATGRCLGIDFGHAFGNGISAAVPELVPFRLTPQILELLRPFTERDLLATIMTHTMQALRDDQGPILACMDIFVYKPVQWLNNNDNEIMRNGNENINADLIWSKKNIEIVAKKLNGIHPSIITLEQLNDARKTLKEAIDDRHFAKYYAIVSGNDEIKQARADIKRDHLTSVEQVDCLLDQAKDLNILGRMYKNWKSWL
ncbi:PREDICTED: DNA-dependent protein kinase catalytic subunit-like [Trachymyrmex cornetzi]|uniref:DNA-dependent protein kinase catalytic subunit n=1 Tax=Trachymyrmex cornetzi TaxID=471704 RepID=A0A195E094_9HYME|nr:PREDICTED: DNA-dependent protein kinase catalytic subunit-like [Trachymyrmex cornetzi]KYN18299.1 DNA-dependent protein kinase catalytic subunit [Trachymyrmex cornetzi]